MMEPFATNAASWAEWQQCVTYYKQKNNYDIFLRYNIWYNNKALIINDITNPGFRFLQEPFTEAYTKPKT